MGVTSTRKIIIKYSMDVSADLEFAALNNINSPGDMGVYLLEAGDNTIELPYGNVRAATVVPPMNNIETITLKGDAADVGLELHPTDPFTLTFPETNPVSFILNAGDDIVGLRIIWT